MAKKRVVALMLAVLVVFGTGSIAGAAVFPDLEARHSWAEDAITSMVTRGILKGYTDGTFKPDRSVTRLEALIIASRIMGVDEEENEQYSEAATQVYTDALSAYNIDYKDEVAYLLYWGVLTTDDLSTYLADGAKDQPLKRYEAAILLAKLVGGAEEVANSSVIILDFADADSIPSSAKAYVEYVYDQGLMNGMDGNRFEPAGELTRAMISTVMYRAENLMQRETVTVTVDAVGSDGVISATANGEPQTVEIPDGAVLRIDGIESDATSLTAGMSLRLHYQNGTIRLADALADNLYLTASGVIETVSFSNGVRRIRLKDTGSGAKSYVLDNNLCEYYIDGAMTSFSAIKSGQYVKLLVQGGVVTKVEVENAAKNYQGTITAVSINEEFSAITVKVSDGSTMDFTFNDDAVVIRNSDTATPLSLAVGDSVTVTVQQGGISRLVATSSSSSVKGVIERIDISSTPQITIKTSTESQTYSVTSDTVFEVDNTTATIYDLRLGATATVRLDSNNIATITTETLVVSPTLTGVITYVHPTSYVMGLSVTNATTGEVETIQTVVKSNAKITDTTSSNISTFRALQPGMTVVVVGTANYGVYEITQIIVTAN